MSQGPYTARIEPRVADNERDAAELRGRVETVSKGGARAAVLGVNDGLVTNVCLILALAGASASASASVTARPPARNRARSSSFWKSVVVCSGFEPASG